MNAKSFIAVSITFSVLIILLNITSSYYKGTEEDLFDDILANDFSGNLDINAINHSIHMWI